MSQQTFIADEATLQEFSGGTERIDLFGHLKTISHTLNQPANTSYSIGQGGAAQALTEDVIELSAQLNGEPPNLECLRVFGDYTDNGDGTYTITPADQLPRYTYKQQKISDGGVATVDEFKFGSYSLSVDSNGNLSVETSGQARVWGGFDDSETISTPSPAGNPREFFHATVKIDGTAVGSVESFNQDFNRNLEAIKGIEDDAASEKRQPTAIIEKLFDVSGSMVINITNSRAYQEALDDSSSPYELQDTRTEVPITLEVDTTAGTDEHTVTGCLFDEISAEMNADGEKRTASMAFVGRTWQTDGDIL